jgi:microsomal dipeptidase-like Zn-dependent dipeptidase
MTRALAVVGAVAATAVAVGFAVVPREVERRMNAVAARPIPVTPRARALHERLFVADLHADTLLWGRELLARGSRGHVDVPRLVEGGVALQAFTVVTKSPRGLNIERNDDRSDDITPLVVAQLWPARTWRSLRARAVYQAQRLDAAAARSEGTLVLVRTAEDLDRFVARRQADHRLVAAILGLEGSHALEGDLANVDVLADAGFRMMAPTHFFDTDIGGSAHGVLKGGLTAKGRDWVARLEERRVLVDLAHASPATIDDVLAIARRPVVVSHTGVRGTCDNRRNLSDDQLRGVARTGGVVGIGFWDTAVCGGDARAVARAAAYAVQVAGADHVALGSDFDGAVTVPFDAAGLPQVTQALLDEGLTEEDTARVMGGNVLRVLRASLP